MNKQWYQSRGIWIGVFTALIGSLEVVRTAVELGDTSTLGIITAGMGILKVWERVTRTI
jgi:hypothetical protein